MPERKYVRPKSRFSLVLYMQQAQQAVSAPSTVPQPTNAAPSHLGATVEQAPPTAYGRGAFGFTEYTIW